MFSGESTPLLKGPIEPWEADACLDVGGAHKTAVLFGGTNDVFIVLIYILYIFQLYFILFTGVPTARKVEPAHRSARALREGAPRGGRVSSP